VREYGHLNNTMEHRHGKYGPRLASAIVSRDDENGQAERSSRQIRISERYSTLDDIHIIDGIQ